MDYVFAYKILTRQRLILLYFKGVVNLEKSIESRLSLSSHKDFDKSFDSIIDFEDAELHFEKQDREKIMKFLKDQPDVQNARLSAYVTNSPNHVALTKLFSLFVRKFKLTNEVFSSINAACDWLLLDGTSRDLVRKEFEKLKQIT